MIRSTAAISTTPPPLLSVTDPPPTTPYPIESVAPAVRRHEELLVKRHDRAQTWRKVGLGVLTAGVAVTIVGLSASLIAPVLGGVLFAVAGDKLATRASQAAAGAGAEHLRLSQGVQATNDLGHQLFARDPKTHAHSVRVSSMAQRFARSLGLSDADIETIGVGAYLHDIGKLSGACS